MAQTDPHKSYEEWDQACHWLQRGRCASASQCGPGKQRPAERPAAHCSLALNGPVPPQQPRAARPACERQGCCWPHASRHRREAAARQCQCGQPALPPAKSGSAARELLTQRQHGLLVAAAETHALAAPGRVPLRPRLGVQSLSTGPLLTPPSGLTRGARCPSGHPRPVCSTRPEERHQQGPVGCRLCCARCSPIGALACWALLRRLLANAAAALMERRRTG